MNSRPAFVWDYDISSSEFQAMLSGELTVGRLGQDWAVVRLLEYGTYREVIQMLGYRQLIEGWPHWRNKIRSDSRKRGYDFLSEWIPEHRPDLLTER